MLFVFFCNGQIVVSFNTNYYGNDYPYQELYISSDSMFLNNFKSNLLENTPIMFTVPANRQKFVYTDSSSFSKIIMFLKSNNDEIRFLENANPYSQIYFIKYFDYSLKESDVIASFGKDAKKAEAFFYNLKKYLINEGLGDHDEVIRELTLMIAALEGSG